MTEREYIEHILKRTEDYIAALGVNEWGDAFAKAHEEWEGTKMALSPFALRGLCRTWLEQDKSGRRHCVFRSRRMKIRTKYDPPPIPLRQFDWSAVTDDYDGAEDSSTRNQIGHGRTEAEAITDLLGQLEDDAA